MTRCAALAVLALLPPSPAVAGEAPGPRPPSVPYTWRSVQMAGGGFVDGIVFHPTARGVVYARTDMGGAYRLSPEARRWEPLLDWVSYEDANLMGIESIALDPSDPERVYLACGTYTSPRAPNGAILRSRDRGRTFERTDVPFKMGGNENGRGNGERMAVDPNDGRILYLGTRHDGLWRSGDTGASWKRIDTFPEVAEQLPLRAPGEPEWMPRGGSGIVFVIFDPKSGGPGQASATIYVGVSLRDRESLFRSADGGRSWQAVPGQPTQDRPTHAVLASDGTLYVTYATRPGPWPAPESGAVWKLDTRSGGWAEISPVKPSPEGKQRFGYAAVAVDAHDPRALVVSTYGRPESKAQEDGLFRSTDGGASWRPVLTGAHFDFSLAPYVEATPIHWMFDVEIDPSDPNHALFTTGYGGWETFDLRDVDAGRPTTWSPMMSGIEETVALELLSPPAGAHLLTAVGDYGGFVHRDLDRPAPEGSYQNPMFGNTNGVACGESAPNVIVRVGRASHHRPGAHIGYSLDGGRSWQPALGAPSPEARLGHIAVSADGETWIWSPEAGPAGVTRDRGTTWSRPVGLPDGIRPTADRVAPRVFYALALFDGVLYSSKDRGATFEKRALQLEGGVPQRGPRGDDRGGQDRLYATPGRKGDLWIAAFDGLHHSTDAGTTFRKLPGVSEIHAFGFGKAAPGASLPALYLVGVVSGVRGVFRSDDAGRRFVRINDERHQWGIVLHVTGDPKRYGRVYVGTHGRGTLYGDPAPVR